MTETAKYRSLLLKHHFDHCFLAIKKLLKEWKNKRGRNEIKFEYCWIGLTWKYWFGVIPVCSLETYWGNEPFGDVDRPGPRHRPGDEPGAGHFWGSGHLQPFIGLQRLQTQEECPRWRSPQSGRSTSCKHSPVVKGNDELCCPWNRSFSVFQVQWPSGLSDQYFSSLFCTIKCCSSII